MEQNSLVDLSEQEKELLSYWLMGNIYYQIHPFFISLIYNKFINIDFKLFFENLGNILIV